MKKGQVTVEYLIALLVFSSILIFLVFQVTRTIPEYTSASREDIIESKAFRVSEVMVTTPGSSDSGSPIWDSSNVAMVGLAISPNNIDYGKLSEFNKTCFERYERSKTAMGIETDYTFRFTNSTTSFSCGKRSPVGVTKAVIERYVAMNDQWGKITLEVW